MPRPTSTRRSRRSTARRKPPAETPYPPLDDVLKRLQTFYGRLPAPPSSAFALYVWDVLSVATTPVRRDAAFGALRRIPALTPEALARLPQAKMEEAVGRAGPLKDERIRALRAAADVFRRRPGIAGELTASLKTAFRAATAIPHLGRASALRLLLFAGNHPVIPLDEHALRVARRLGYHAPTAGRPREDADPPPRRLLRDTRRVLTAAASGDVARLRGAALYLTHHGLASCTESSPHCAVCPLAADCRWLRGQ